ncbi:MAG: 5-oxoprolinase subunit PxpB [Saprospiraceae bacterium]|nr:5-oxoprolinase subunit PxpB [Saprospiraceae bacterium]|tara:strand:- start:6311 stop:7021 length:711 start_codon:yes stop_codon:yes gene_type:complete
MKELIFNNPYQVNALLVDHGFLLLQWPQHIADEIITEILSLSHSIENIEHIIDVVPAYTSLGIFYDVKRTNHKKILEKIKTTQVQKLKDRGTKVIQVPICYDPLFASDIGYLSSSLDLTISEIINIHSNPTYRVSFIGFLPGFMYLSGMDNRLKTPRRTEPRPVVPRGAVAIGGNQTGIYPLSSPGGWHIIGRCPLLLFDKKAKIPSKFIAGDLIKMVAITKEEFDSVYQKEYNND